MVVVSRHTVYMRRCVLRHTGGVPAFEDVRQLVELTELPQRTRRPLAGAQVVAFLVELLSMHTRY